MRDDQIVKIELLSQWKLEAEFRNFSRMSIKRLLTAVVYIEEKNLNLHPMRGR